MLSNNFLNAFIINIHYYILELRILLSEDIKSFTNDTLQFELAAVHKLCNGKVFGSNLVNAESFLTVNIASNDCLDQITGKDVHGEYLVILAAHDHVALASLDTGIEDIFLLLAEQPAEITAVSAERIEARHNPSHELIGMISLGYYVHFCRVGGQIAIL